MSENSKKKSSPKHKADHSSYTQKNPQDPTLLEEPASPAYWLGIGNTDLSKIQTEFDLMELGNRGVSKDSLEKVIEHLGLSKRMMAEDILDISVKTLERKDLHEKLDKRSSSHIIEIAKLIQHAYLVFKDKAKVKWWMNRENDALEKKKPVSLMHSLTGINLINDLLGRIEEGVYS